MAADKIDFSDYQHECSSMAYAEWIYYKIYAGFKPRFKAEPMEQ